LYESIPAPESLQSPVALPVLYCREDQIAQKKPLIVVGKEKVLPFLVIGRTEGSRMFFENSVIAGLKYTTDKNHRKEKC
jgi:hypothetical protein